MGDPITVVRLIDLPAYRLACGPAEGSTTMTESFVTNPESIDLGVDPTTLLTAYILDRPSSLDQLWEYLDELKNELVSDDPPSSQYLLVRRIPADLFSALVEDHEALKGVRATILHHEHEILYKIRKVRRTKPDDKRNHEQPTAQPTHDKLEHHIDPLLHLKAGEVREVGDEKVLLLLSCIEEIPNTIQALGRQVETDDTEAVRELVRNEVRITYAQ
ncbi:hypothetical protein N7465_010771 [Penicillium sp. CMV-2018d]|nr:hypothetical protein N7465_010771 [Penicillium sp. CMV-2018d]